MIYESDKFIEALWDLRMELLLQPDEYVKSSIIEKPFRKFLIATYKIYRGHIIEKKALITQ
jgi:hypothetical protein